MQRLVCMAPALCAGLIAVLGGPPLASAQYISGFEWNRAADWLEGAEHGSRTNNPGPDAAGTPVWSYEAARGPGLDSAEPWYGRPTTPMTWDEHWWDSGHGVWSLGDDVNPPIFSDRMTHNLGAKNHENIPLVRWINPAGDGATIDLTGTLGILWTGADFIGAPTDVDVVVALFDASSQVTASLYEGTVSKPFDGLSVGDAVELPMNLSGITLDYGDSILISLRAHDILPGHWIAMADSGVTMTLIPGPWAPAALALAPLCARRRRKPSYRPTAPA